MRNLTMGNEESHYPKFEIEEEAVEVTDNWTLHTAKDIDGNVPVHSAFISQFKLNGGESLPLERLAKNLMVLRHPYIIKYVTSWKRSNKLHLITEEVRPLSLTVTNQSALQICIGLHNVLSALVFLHEKASSSHNNVCCASIYTTLEGTWKLGGLEYLKKFSEVTPAYLKETRDNRYEKAVAPEEDSFSSNSKINAEALDKYAFGILVDELLRKKSNDDLPFLLEFRDYCKKELQNGNPDNRVRLLEVLEHPFFNHNFIKISKFLYDLPLKTNIEKEQFFSGLTEQLNLLPEEVVGCQMASLLLSRVVLLDNSAQKHFLPVLLQPKANDEKETRVALFSEDVFKTYLVPKLLKIFCVRDVQIRMILLNNFHLYCNMFTAEELKHHILPELLVGIKDVNDSLVSTTLKALSQLVIILGAKTVIGGKRGKLFTDGRPNSVVRVPAPEPKSTSIPKDKSPTKVTMEILFTNNRLPERLSPDGGEDNSSSSVVEEADGDTEHWSDWDLPADKSFSDVIAQGESLETANEESSQLERLSEPSTESRSRSSETTIGKQETGDITFLDIKSMTEIEKGIGEDINFFHDMEPVISKTQVLNINPSKTKFDVESDLEPVNSWDGWNEDWDVGENQIK